jgi:hypothetical protein
MSKDTAFTLIKTYITGWQQNDLALITSCLAENCVITESHGPTYYSIAQIEEWFSLWLVANSTVLHWDISSFYFCEQQQTAFCEWDFACVSNGVEYALPGISVVKFSGNKIGSIHEYRMTQPAYDWQGDSLKSS